MIRAILLFILLIIAVVGGVLAHLNAEAVTFNYYFSSISLPLAVLLFLVLVLGAISGVLLTAGMFFYLRRQKRQLQKRLAVCEQELKNLRDIPIKGPL